MVGPFLLRAGETGIAGMHQPLRGLMHIAQGEAAIFGIDVADRPRRAAALLSTAMTTIWSSLSVVSCWPSSERNAALRPSGRL